VKQTPEFEQTWFYLLKFLLLSLLFLVVIGQLIETWGSGCPLRSFEQF